MPHCETCGDSFDHPKGPGRVPRYCLEHRIPRGGRSRRKADQLDRPTPLIPVVTIGDPRHYRDAARRCATESLGERAYLMEDAIERYSRAVELDFGLHDAWGRMGRPVMAVGHGGVMVAHPLLDAFRKTRQAAAFHAEIVGLGALKNAPGGQLGVARAPDRKKEPPRLVRLVPRPDAE